MVEFLVRDKECGCVGYIFVPPTENFVKWINSIRTKFDILRERSNVGPVQVEAYFIGL